MANKRDKLVFQKVLIIKKVKSSKTKTAKSEKMLIIFFLLISGLIESGENAPWGRNCNEVPFEEMETKGGKFVAKRALISYLERKDRLVPFPVGLLVSATRVFL